MKQSVNDKWFRLSGIFLLILLSLAVDDFYDRPLTGLVFIKFLFTVGGIMAIWYLNRTVILYFRSVFSSQGQTARRLLFTFVVSVLLNTLLSSLLRVLDYLLIYKVTLADYLNQEHATSLTINNIKLKLYIGGFDVLSGIEYALFFMAIYGVLFFIRDSSFYKHRLTQVEHEKEELRAAHLQSQLDALKQHVNPHFLFNALNSLSALISEDPPQAEKFVDKLSEVYRYLLRSNQQHLTTLEAELQFLNAYYHLLQTRYGAALTVEVSVNDAYFPYQLPPLSLQLLVENAVKHNVASTKQPLHIQVMIDNQDRLLVSNTLRRKNTRVLSNGVGLSNIIAKYQMLNLPQPIVSETDKQFTVALPLLA